MAPTPSFPDIALAAALAYLLGSIPAAYLCGRVKGIDIFKVGSGQAGSTNVWREVSRKAAALTFFTDFAKGLAALLVARALGLHSEFLLIPAFATVLAHWNSPWTHFKGGDGIAPFTGVGIGFAPHLIAIPYALILVITLAWNKRLNHPALWGAVIGYIAILGMAFVPATRTTPVEALGFTGLGALIVLHSVVFRRRRRRKVLELLAAELAAEVAQDANEILDQPGKALASESAAPADDGDASPLSGSRA
jgi:glycerol-3-phosphate acyltransferase PlsY